MDFRPAWSSEPQCTYCLPAKGGTGSKQAVHGRILQRCRAALGVATSASAFPCQSTGRRQHSMRGLSRAQGETKMLEQGIRNPDFGADKFGFRDLHALNWNLLEPELYECAINGGAAQLPSPGALYARNRRRPRPLPHDNYSASP